MSRVRPEKFLKPKLLAASVAACFALNAGALRANPAGPTVISGGVGFSGLGTSALTITNQAGGNAIINWNGFSIGVNELTKFQQFANLSVLNRVTGSQLSSILGSLQSDGRVFLINPNGIVFGASARIDAAGLVASSLALSDQDFLANRLHFTEVPGAGAVVNNGVIETAAGGRVYLVAPTVENNGLIQSPQGAIVLAAGKEVELVDAASPFVTVKVAAAEQAVNVGDLVAEGGQIGMFGALVRNSGVVSAGGAVAGPGGEIRLVAAKDLALDAGSLVSANGTSGGKVLLQAEGGTNLVGGTVEAKGNSGRGGEVSALGVRVGVVGHGVIDASGDSGGGTVLVGGDYQGKNSAVQNAERTYIGADGVIRADAMTTGDGGRVVVWADGDTRFNGNISAKGGARAGDGGFAEVSGKQFLDYRGLVNLIAPAGKVGTLLLDPQDIRVVYGGVVSNPDITEDVESSPATFTSNSDVNGSTTLTDGSINAQLAYSSVLVQTGGSAGNAGDITFDAYGGSISLSSIIGSNLSFDATGNISFVNGRTYASLNSGLLTLRAGGGTIASGTPGDDLFLSSTPLLLVAGSGIGSSDNPLQLMGATELAATSGSKGIYINAGTFSDLIVTSLSNGDLSGGTVSASGLTTSNAPISLTALQSDGGGTIALDAAINSGTARTTLVADDHIFAYYGGGPKVIAGELVMSSVNGIGCGSCRGVSGAFAQHPLEIQVASLQAMNSQRGVEIHNSGDLTLKDIDGSGYAIDNAGGSAAISSTGNLTVAGSVSVGNRFSLVANGSLYIDADISGGTSGEGSKPSELIADANDDRIGSIAQAAGTSITSDNELNISIVCSFGCENGGGPSGQHITLGAVDAGGNDILVRNEHGGIFANGDGQVSASRLMLRAEQGIDLDTSVATLQVRHAQKGGSGAVTIRNTLDGGTLALESFFLRGDTAIENGNGSISISNDGSIDIVNTVNSGSAGSTLSSGSEILASGSTYYGGAAILASNLILSAVNGIGKQGNFITTEVSSLQATNTNGGIEIQNIGNLTLANLGAGYAVQNPNGALILSSDSNITVGGSVSVGRRISLRANGDLAINANLTGHEGGETSSAVDLVADADANGAGSISSMLGTGNIVTNGGDMFATGASVALGGINTGATSSSQSGGNVVLQASGGSITINGGISTRGASGDSSNSSGGWGGDIDLSAPGPIKVSGTIDASGGNGAANAYGGYGGSGGWGGSIDISGSSITLGGIRSRGGDGGPSTAYGGVPTTGGDGGEGGGYSGVHITGTGLVQVNVGGTLGAVAIDVSGGAGGAGNAAASPAGVGGDGGKGGFVSVTGTPNMTFIGSVLAAGGSGGAGGAGNASFPGGDGGAGGPAGSILLDASSITGSRTADGIIFVLAGTQFNVQGGLGGTGGAGGGVPGSSGLSNNFIKLDDYFGTIVVLDPLSVPEINAGFQQIVKGGDDSTIFVGGEKKEEEEEDKTQKEIGSCKG
jgi:filamentous hemagglutinin family protein